MTVTPPCAAGADSARSYGHDAPPRSATPHATAPAEPNATPVAVRFRERVRARVGRAELLAFRVGGERFAFDVRALDEAIDAPSIDAVPHDASAPDTTAHAAFHGDDLRAPAAGGGTGASLVGLARVGARSIPVFDTGRLLGVIARGVAAHVLVMRSGTQRIGLLAEEVDDVIVIDLGTIKPPPFDAGDDLLLGVTWDGEEITGILDARALIAACQFRATEAAA